MEYPNIDFDAPRREREKVENQIHALWRKWDKQGGPNEDEKDPILEEIGRPRGSKGYSCLLDSAISVKAEAMITYRYKDMDIFEFMGYGK